MRGQIGANIWAWDGDPNNADIDALNVPKGAVVIDISTPAIWLKTTARGSTNTAGYTQVGGAGTIAAKVTVANQTARFALTTATVQNGDYVYQTDTAILYEVTDQTALSSSAGYTALASVTAAQISNASANGRSLITAADYAAMKILLALTIGTNVQAWDAQLDSLAAFTAQQVTNLGVASGTKIYRALLTQSGTDVPVATVLENTLGGTVVWARSAQGIYTATLASVFTTAKTLCFVTGGSESVIPKITYTSTSVLTLAAGDFEGGTNDDALVAASLSIIVYP